MAAANLLTLLDDIASILDDVSVMTKVAAKKTAGVLGDDLALNAQQVTGVQAERELPVVWAVAKGSLLNKAILVPLALLISAFAPWAVSPLLMVGGAYLCYEGAEKLAHRWLHAEAERAAQHQNHVDNLQHAPKQTLALEKDKIKGAVRTDFVLSAEIIAITLGVTQGQPLLEQFAVLAGISVLMTLGVYGLVAGIVKLDDLGLFLSQRRQPLLQTGGRAILRAAPWLMKGLSVVGTAAMFLVGGGILAHGLTALAPLLHTLEAAGGWRALLGVNGLNALLGLAAGALLVALQSLLRQLRSRG
jgi:predicted DNA repair protein MutK